MKVYASMELDEKYATYTEHQLERIYIERADLSVYPDFESWLWDMQRSGVLIEKEKNEMTIKEKIENAKTEAMVKTALAEILEEYVDRLERDKDWWSDESEYSIAKHTAYDKIIEHLGKLI